jgi:ribonuclease D
MPLLAQPTVVTTLPALRNLATHLATLPAIAIDTESNSLYAYRERVCLVQISSRQHDWLVDPLYLDDISPLGPVLANPAIEKVFHAAEYDVMCLKRDYDFSFANLFDTMMAARILGRKAIGLGALLKEYFGVEADKRYQKADWSIRPLPSEYIAYAQQDTHYLLDVRDRLAQELAEKNATEEAAETFRELVHAPASEGPNFNPDGFWDINSARHFSRINCATIWPASKMCRRFVL